MKRQYPNIRWTAGLDAWLRQVYAENINKHLAAELAQKLGRPVTKEQVKVRAAKLGLRKTRADLAVNGQFVKGQKPHNKGLKGWQSGGRSAETRFKPGHLGGNAAEKQKPVGYEGLDTDGYLRRKVNDGLPRHKRWRHVHLLLWEEHHGPIPEGHCVVFKNGDKTDIRIDNLILVTRAENMQRNTIHRYPPELRAAIRTQKRLEKLINEKLDARRTQ